MAQELSPEEFHKWTDKRTNRNSLFWESERNETHVSQFKSQNPIRRNDKCFCFFLLSDVRFVASSVASEHHWNTTWPNTKPRPTWSLSAWCAASVSRRPTTWTCTCPWCTRWHRLRLRGAAGSSSRHTRTYTPSRWPGRWFSKSKTDDRRKSWFKADTWTVAQDPETKQQCSTEFHFSISSWVFIQCSFTLTLMTFLRLFSRFVDDTAEKTLGKSSVSKQCFFTLCN